MTNHNDVTGDKIITKTKAKTFDDNFDLIFRKPAKEDWNEEHIDFIGQNGGANDRHKRIP